MPLIILAVLSIVTGYFGIPEFLEPMFERERRHAHASGALSASCCWRLPWDCSGIAGAYYVYVLHPSLPDRLARQWQDGVSRLAQ